jgi:hypothetical protein
LSGNSNLSFIPIWDKKRVTPGVYETK